MEYLLISLAVACFAAQFAFTKLYESAADQTGTASLIMLVGTSLVGALIFFGVGGFSVSFSRISTIWAAIFAVIMIPYYLIGIKVLSLGSLAIYSMFMMLGGMLVPFFYGVWFLKESVSAAQVIGTVLLTGFIMLQAISQSDSNTERVETQSTKKKLIFFTLCLVIFFLSGLTGVIVKKHQISEGAVDEVSFTVISCALTAIFSLILLVFDLFRNGKEKRRQLMAALKIKPLWIIALLGVATHAGNFLHLLAANDVPASVQFPLVSGGVIVLSALVSLLAFKEKLSAKEWISIGGAFLSTVLFAF